MRIRHKKYYYRLISRNQIQILFLSRILKDEVKIFLKIKK